MRSELRWAVVVAVLAVAGVLALWPRPPSTVDPSKAQRPPAERVTGQVDDAALAAARASAALPACPSAARAAGSPHGPLDRLVVRCLGQPGTVALGPALAGRPVLLNLWASWCKPCRDEMPALDAYAASPGAIAVLGVNVRDQPGNALALAAQLDLHYPSVTDPDNAVAAALGAPPVLPTSWVIRPDGTAERVIDPLVFDRPEQIRDAVERALAQ